jgi:hypothetical protein
MRKTLYKCSNIVSNTFNNYSTLLKIISFIVEKNPKNLKNLTRRLFNFQTFWNFTEFILYRNLIYIITVEKLISKIHSWENSKIFTLEKVLFTNVVCSKAFIHTSYLDVCERIIMGQKSYKNKQCVKVFKSCLKFTAQHYLMW